MRVALLSALGVACLAAVGGLFFFADSAGRGASEPLTPRRSEAAESRAPAALRTADDAPRDPAPRAPAATRTTAQAEPAPTTANGPASLGVGAPQSLRGLVRSLGGPPLAGARLQLSDRTGKLVGTTSTDGEGRFTLLLESPLKQGQLEASAGGHVPFRLSGVTVPEGTHRNLGQLHLDRVALFEGRVVDVRGAPLAGVRAILHVNARGSRTDLSAATDGDGRFRFPGAPSTGRHTLELVTAGGVVRSFPVSLPVRVAGGRVREFRL